MSYLMVKDTYTIGSVPDDNELPILLSAEIFKESSFRAWSLRKRVSTVECVQQLDRKEIAIQNVEELRKEHANELRALREKYAEEMRAQEERHSQKLRAAESFVNELQEKLEEFIKMREDNIKKENACFGSAWSLTPASTRKGSRSRQSSPTKKSVFSSDNIH